MEEEFNYKNELHKNELYKNDNTTNELYGNSTTYDHKQSLGVEEVIILLQETLDKMENDIKLLWIDVLLPEISATGNKKILHNITENDYNKFYTYMINNSPAYNVAFRKLQSLLNK